MIKNIIFDMGGVLIHFNPQYFLNTILNNENDRKTLWHPLR